MVCLFKSGRGDNGGPFPRQPLSCFLRGSHGDRGGGWPQPPRSCGVGGSGVLPGKGDVPAACQCTEASVARDAAWSRAGRAALGGAGFDLLCAQPCPWLHGDLCHAWRALATEAGAWGVPLCPPASRRGVCLTERQSARVCAFWVGACSEITPGRAVQGVRVFSCPRGVPCPNPNSKAPFCPFPYPQGLSQSSQAPVPPSLSPSCPLLPSARPWGLAGSCEER